MKIHSILHDFWATFSTRTLDVEGGEFVRQWKVTEEARMRKRAP
jgi:hypothetical protein